MMGSDPTTVSRPAAEETNCLLGAVATAMKSEPALSAVRIDRKHRSISLATLGRPHTADLEHQLTARLRQLESATDGPRCALLEGAPDCATCSTVPAADQKHFTIEQLGDSTTIARVTCVTAPRFWHWREVPWPKLVPRKILLPDEAEHEDEWKAQIAAAALCGVFGLTAYFLGEGNLRLTSYIAAYVAGSWFTIHEIWERLQQRILDVHFLMLTVAIGSACIGAWGEGATLLFLFSFSSALEHYAMGRTQREIRSLFKTAPKEAIVLDQQGQERVVPVAELDPGMRLLVKPGQQFPVDAEIVSGRTASDESNLTGEAVPVEKTIGDSVLAGTMNLWGVVETRVLRPESESALQKIIRLIHEAQHLKAPSQRLTDKFGTHYTYVVLGLALVMFFVWWLGLRHAPFESVGGAKSAFYCAMTLLVVSSPCALVLSIPSAILAAIAWAARRGILFRGGAAVEKLAEINVVAMDKTGTLTTGELKVEHVESYPPGRERDIAQLAYSLERLSTHPLARAITRHGKQQQLQPLVLEHFESVTGLGLRAQRNGKTVWLGRREWVAGDDASGVALQTTASEPGVSEVWLREDGLLGRLVLRDDLRAQAAPVVARLRALGLRTLVLTGDRKSAAAALQEQLHVDEIHAELKPEQKVESIAAMSRAGGKVAMIGDGVNDAPSLAVAHVGVAMGARGSDAALEQAEVVLMHDRLENFLTAYQLSQRARRIIRQNLFVSLGTVVVLVAFAMFGAIPLTVGVLGHEGSTVIVVLNSLRLLFSRPQAIRHQLASRLIRRKASRR